MPYAVSYTRFSALHQGRGSSVERQQGLINKWLGEHPEYKLSPLSKNDEGRSAFKGEHLKHGLGSILEAVQSKKIQSGDVLLIEALDRLGRQTPMEMLEIIGKILKSGISIVTLEDGTEYSNKSTADEGYQLYVLLGKIQQAHEYSAKLSRRVRAAYIAKEKKAHAGEKIKKLNPLWLNSDGTLREKESEFVKKCIDLYLKGHGTRSILLQFHDTSQNLNKVHPSTLKRWFQNKALIGEWRGAYPLEPLISKDTFYKLQQQLMRRRREMSPEQTYELSGVVICSNCNSRYYFRRKTHNEEVIIYGNCSTYLKRGEKFCSNNTSLPYEVLMHAFDLSKFDHLWLAAAQDALDKTLETIELLEIEKTEISNKIIRLLKVLEVRPDQPQTIDRLSTLDSEQSTITKTIDDLKAGHQLKQTNYTLLDYYTDLAKGSEVADKIHDKTKEFNNDPIMQREALKQAGYKILAHGKNIEHGPGFKFELVRRSQIYKRYIVRCTIHNKEQNEVFISWVAINRNLRPLEARSEDELIKAMKAWHPSDDHLIDDESRELTQLI